MEMLEKEIAAVEQYAPGLDAKLRSLGLAELESGSVKLAGLIREANLTGLIIPRDLGGRGASLVEAIRIQRVLGARSPSLAVMTTMHGFSCSFLSLFGVFDSTGASALREICAQRKLVASGFGEGRPGASLFDYETKATRVDGGYRLNGRKRPCTLARDMDVLTLGFGHVDAEGRVQTGFAMLPSNASGLQVRPFWKSNVLAAAGSEEVVLEDVFVPDSMIFVPGAEDQESQDKMRALEALGLSSFQLFVAGSYVGVATNLAARIAASTTVSNADLVDVYTEVEGAMLTLEGAAHRIANKPFLSEVNLAETMAARFAAQKNLQRAVDLAVELLGGNAFIGDPLVSYLQATSRCLAFHPIGRRHSDDIIGSVVRAQT